MVGIVLCWMIILGLFELLCVQQTGETVSEWQVAWQAKSVRDYYLSWIGQYAKVSAMIYFMLHMK